MTRRIIALKWTFYALAALLAMLVQSLVFQRLHIWGVCPFVLPCVPTVAASFESRRGGIIFAAVFGGVCDLLLTAPVPFFYTVTLALCALLSGVIARHAILPGLPCTLIVSLLALALHGLFQTVLLGYRSGASILSGLYLTLRETAVTLPFMIPFHPLLRAIHKRMISA